MKKVAVTLVSSMLLTACSHGVSAMSDTDKSKLPCGDKPNCVSTQDQREQHSLAPFRLSASATLEAIEKAALSLGRASTAVKEQDYLRIEFTSRVFRFVDDLELRMEGDQLIVRSESRTGYSDFGVNRERAENLRAALLDAKQITP